MNTPAQNALKPVLSFAPEVLLRAQDVRVAFFDVDGVLTDGGLFFSEAGETFKRFSVLDGHGLKLIQQIGITPVVISGRDTPAVRARLAGLGLTRMHLGVADKLGVAQAELAVLGCDWEQAAAIGDDWPDLPLLCASAFACAPCNAHVEVKAVAHHVTLARGGDGAVREFCDLLLTASGRYASLLRGEQHSTDRA